MNRPLRAGLLGFGNVASATIASHMNNRDLIARKTRRPIEFVRVATRTPARASGRVPPGCRVDDDLLGLVDDPTLDAVVELTGSVPQGRELLLRALAGGKHVVTANKALLALHGEEILDAAQAAGCRVLFEGAVAVSIPIVKTLREAAAANRLESVVGILNGTSNYILSRMSEHGASFAEALREAQSRGYAEADPTLDVNGQDAAHKITLLAALAFGMPIDFEQVDCRGIEAVDRDDVEHARRLGFELKLIAQARGSERGLYVGVQPTLVRRQSLLAQVPGAMNGIALSGDLMGPAFLYGSGAGGTQTASAVLADLIELANIPDGAPALGDYNLGHRRQPQAQAARPLPLVCPFYLCVRTPAQADAQARLRPLMAAADIELLHAESLPAGDQQTDHVFLTGRCAESVIRRVLPELQALAGPGLLARALPLLDE